MGGRRLGLVLASQESTVLEMFAGGTNGFAHLLNAGLARNLNIMSFNLNWTILGRVLLQLSDKPFPGRLP